MGSAAARRRSAATIKGEIGQLAKDFAERSERLFLVGGSWRAIARIDMERRGYPLRVLHEYRMTPQGILDTIKYIGKTEIDDLRASTGTSAERMRLVPLAAEVLKVLVRKLKPREIADRYNVISVSSYGIREGLL